MVKLKEWKQYRVSLSRLDQQAGWPADIQWPVAPEVD
ncbi:phage tail assembly chaperone [Pseudomonas nitroreducens]